jgi:hypothetical protein
MNENVSGTNSDRLVTKDELASKLHLHPNTLDNLVERGLIEGHYKIGNSVRFSLQEVMESIRVRNTHKTSKR